MAFQADNPDARQPTSPEDAGELSLDAEIDALSSELETELEMEKALDEQQTTQDTIENVADDLVEFVVDDPAAQEVAQEPDVPAADVGAIENVETLLDDVETLVSEIDVPSELADIQDDELDASIDDLIADAESVTAEIESAEPIDATDNIEEKSTGETLNDADEDVVFEVVESDEPVGQRASELLDDSSAETSLESLDESLAEGATGAVTPAVDEAIATAAGDIDIQRGAKDTDPDPLANVIEETIEECAQEIAEVRDEIDTKEGVDADQDAEDSEFTVADDVVDDAIADHGVVVEDDHEEAGVALPEHEPVDDGSCATADDATSKGAPKDADPNGDVLSASEIPAADELAELMSAAEMPTDVIDVTEEIDASPEAEVLPPAEDAGTPADDEEAAAVSEPSVVPAEEKSSPAAENSDSSDNDTTLPAAASEPKVKLVAQVTQKASKAGQTSLRVMNIPFTFVPATHRSTVGWISINTAFLGVGFLIVSMMGRGSPTTAKGASVVPRAPQDTVLTMHGTPEDQASSSLTE